VVEEAQVDEMAPKASVPENPLAAVGGMPDLVALASSILARESSGVHGTPSSAVADRFPSGVGDISERICPVTGATTPLPGAGKEDLRRQAHELLGSLMSYLGQREGGPYQTAPTGYPAGGTAASYMPALAGRSCPVTKASLPVGALDLDLIRRQAHGLIETLLVTFNEATGEKGLPAEDKVPLIQGAAPVSAGSEARASLVVVNEEPTPSEVALYCSDFISDSGHEIPSLRVSVVPRRTTIAVGGKTIFEIKIAVPQQTPPGNYSTLIQAMGCKYVKAVLSIEVS
jgi:hypothetical protein